MMYFHVYTFIYVVSSTFHLYSNGPETSETFGNLGSKAEYGVDFYISGHTHLQNASTFGDTPYVISGGGGGITSEILPSTSGDDDGYGFMDVRITRDIMQVTPLFHGLLSFHLDSVVSWQGFWHSKADTTQYQHCEDASEKTPSQTCSVPAFSS